jgi:hypothetical protein
LGKGHAGIAAQVGEDTEDGGHVGTVKKCGMRRRRVLGRDISVAWKRWRAKAGSKVHESERKCSLGGE